MSREYLENPVLLVNSSGPTVASGRNVRAKFRTNQAAKKIRSETRNGQFGVFGLGHNLSTAHPPTFSPGEIKTKTISVEKSGKDTSIVPRPNKYRRKNGSYSQPLPSPLPSPPPGKPTQDLSRLVDYATFHIRLVSALTVTTAHSRLKQILLCRQWACLHAGAERAGKSPVLDSALDCVAFRLERLNGSGTSLLDDIGFYRSALAQLYNALENPAQHEVEDLRISSQLLAVYEMLESIDGSGWELHIRGVRMLSQPQAAVLDIDGRRCAMTVPMVAEALLTGNNTLFNTDTWRSFSISDHHDRTLATCMFDLPMLLSDTKLLCSSLNFNMPLQASLLNRALMLKSRIRGDLLKNDLDVDRHHMYDKVGLCLAGLIALDRAIASIEDSDLAAQKRAEEETAELCKRILQLDLGANGAYAAYDLMRAFRLSSCQEQAGYIIVLPGRSRS